MFNFLKILLDSNKSYLTRNLCDLLTVENISAKYRKNLDNFDFVKTLKNHCFLTLC